MRRIVGILLTGIFAGCGGGGGGSDDGSGSESAIDPRFVLDSYDAEKAYDGTTFFTTNYDPDDTRIVQVDMQGEVVWEYSIPDVMKTAGQIAIDAEFLPDSETILIAATKVGLFEVSYPEGEIVWSVTETDQGPVRISHDADRLPSGNTLYAYGHNDVEGVHDQATEVAPDGTVVWRWAAWEHAEFDGFSGTYDGGWVHANAVQRLPNGNTMISLRNFHMTAVVETTVAGNVVALHDWSAEYGVCDPHEPEFEPGAPPRVLVALQRESPYQAVEVEWPSGTFVWGFSLPGLRTTRDADRLPNGNTLLMGVLETDGVEDSVILEVTPAGEVVWQLRLAGYDEAKTPGFIYKAQRVGS